MWTKTTIYSFTSAAGSPGFGLLAGPDGVFYGTASPGIVGTGGTVFQLSPPLGSEPWTVTTLYTFAPSTSGNGPGGRLISDGFGNLYGITQEGGLHGGGTVYELSPPAQNGDAWTETTLYSFTGGNDGREPFGGLVMDATGTIYGTTVKGGSYDLGVVFELAPPAQTAGPWVFTIIWTFAGPPEDGAEPTSRLLLDASGNLYGTANEGGAHGTRGYGTAFQLAPVSDGSGLFGTRQSSIAFQAKRKVPTPSLGWSGAETVCSTEPPKPPVRMAAGQCSRSRRRAPPAPGPRLFFIRFLSPAAAAAIPRSN